MRFNAYLLFTKQACQVTSKMIYVERTQIQQNKIYLKALL